MILPYLLRLLCLCFASFFVLNLAAGLFVRISAESAIRFAESRSPKAAARFLLILRLLPFALATLFVLALCVPSYLWLEPGATAERVGTTCAILGIFGAATWSVSIARTIHSLRASMRHYRYCRSVGHASHVPGGSSSAVVIEPVVVVREEAPVVALSGLLRPRLLISTSVLRALSAEELDAALRHERAHRTSRDNAKRLLILLAPDILPFVRPFQNLERGWSKFAEWAADDQAADGDSRRALSLAAALVRVARMGSAPRLPVLSTSLLACDRDLSARVDRLLHAAPIAPSRNWKPQLGLRTAGFLLVGVLAALLLAPSALSSVHELLELLLH
jgi:beta-lactamase regulating signal transducer with metallopeptidase domain